MTKKKVAIIGAGRWGPNLIRNFQNNNKSELIMVVDHDSSRLDQIQKRYDGVQVSTQFADVIKSNEIDTVVICTPTATHYDFAKQSLLAGKHVFVEKPLATNIDHCRELVQLANRNQLTLFVGHIFVYNAGIQAVKSYIQNNDLGKIHYFQINRTNLGPVRTDVNALWDLAPHDLSILQYWLGERPTAVSAFGACYLNDPIEDVVFATYKYSQGVVANIHVSWLNPKKVREIVIVGEKKMLIWDDMNLTSPVQIYDKSIDYSRPESGISDSFVGFRNSIYEGDTLIPKVKLNEPLAAECQAFLDSIADSENNLSDGQKGLEVVAALQATDKSLQSKGALVEINY